MQTSVKTTNEELATLIQSGRQDLVLKLWEQVLPWIRLQAIRQYNRNNGQGGTEIDDLIQAAFIALIEAVEDFDATSGFTFLTYLSRPLKSAFAITCGYRTAKQAEDPLQHSASLDCPIDCDDADGATLGDLQPDPNAQAGFEAVDEQIYNSELKAALDDALALLPELQAQILRAVYYEQQSRTDFAADNNLKYSKVTREETNALHTLRKKYKRTKLKGFIENRTNYYSGTSLRQFNRTGLSSVELLTFKREALRDLMQQDTTL